LYSEQSDWDTDSDEDNTLSEREELPTIIRVDRIDRKVDALSCDCTAVVNVLSPIIYLDF